MTEPETPTPAPAKRKRGPKPRADLDAVASIRAAYIASSAEQRTSLTQFMSLSRENLRQLALVADSVAAMTDDERQFSLDVFAAIETREATTQK
jgi:hypothetical protein